MSATRPSTFWNGSGWTAISKPGRVSIVEEGTHFGALTDIIVNSNRLCFPVRGAGDRITGILAVEDLRKVLYEHAVRTARGG